MEAVGEIGVKELKDELRKRGREITGKKVELVPRLKDAIASNVPVSSGYEAARHVSMNGLDMGATWEFLTQNAAPEQEEVQEVRRWNSGGLHCRRWVYVGFLLLE